MYDRYLLFRRDRKTGELVSFSWQGRTKEISVEEVKKNIAEWNNNKNNETLYELCDSEIMKQDCFLLQQKLTIKQVKDMLHEVECYMEEIKSCMRRIEETVSTMKEVEDD